MDRIRPTTKRHDRPFQCLDGQHFDENSFRPPVARGSAVPAAQTYVVTAEIPGMKTDDLEIKVVGETLTIKGERKPLDIGNDASYHRRERATGTFHRSMALPNRVDADNVKATYKDGVLIITLEKERVAQPKQITITTE
jgi:HSP20 family molecular chaperone IbpA